MIHLSVNDAKAIAALLESERLTMFLKDDLRAEDDGQHGTALSVDPLGPQEEWLATLTARVTACGPEASTEQQDAFATVLELGGMIACSGTPFPAWGVQADLDPADIRAWGYTHAVFATPKEYEADAEAMQPGSTADHGQSDPADAS